MSECDEIVAFRQKQRDKEIAEIERFKAMSKDAVKGKIPVRLDKLTVVYLDADKITPEFIEAKKKQLGL